MGEFLIYRENRNPECYIGDVFKLSDGNYWICTSVEEGYVRTKERYNGITTKTPTSVNKRSALIKASPKSGTPPVDFFFTYDMCGGPRFEDIKDGAVKVYTLSFEEMTGIYESIEKAEYDFWRFDDRGRAFGLNHFKGPWRYPSPEGLVFKKETLGSDYFIALKTFWNWERKDDPEDIEGLTIEKYHNNLTNHQRLTTGDLYECQAVGVLPWDFYKFLRTMIGFIGWNTFIPDIFEMMIPLDSDPNYGELGYIVGIDQGIGVDGGTNAGN